MQGIEEIGLGIASSEAGVGILIAVHGVYTLYGSLSDLSNITGCESLYEPLTDWLKDKIGRGLGKIPNRFNPKVSSQLGIDSGDGPKPRVNKLGPDPEAIGPHTRFKINPETGRVTGYTEFDSEGNPVKRFRGEGKPHGGMEPPFILEPKPGKGPGSPPKVPRKPNPDELPRGY